MAAATRAQLRGRFDSLLAFNFPANSASPEASTSQVTLTPVDHVELARLLSVFYIESNPEDAQRLARWAREVVSPRKDQTSVIPLLFLLDGQPASLSASWRVLVTSLARKMLGRIGSHGQSGQTLLYLEMVKVLLDGQMYAKAGIGGEVLVEMTENISRSGLWAHLRQNILGTPVEAKSTSSSLLPAVQLSLLPFATLTGPSLSSAHAEFTRQILTIPLLPNRIPISALTHLSTKMPFEGVLASVGAIVSQLQLEETVHLLSNLLAFGSKRVSLLPSKAFVAYLTTLQYCLDVIPTAFFAHLDRARQPQKKANTSSQEESDAIAADATEAIEDSDAPFARSAVDRNGVDGDVVMSEQQSTFPFIDSRTYTWLATLSAPAHLSAIVAASTKSSGTSRPALCAFFVSLLFAWPSHRERVINALLFAGTGASERGGGLLREIWRGYVRSGKLGVGLRDRRLGGTPSAVVAAAANTDLRSEWETLILLAELYARCLLTLGDDEFFNDGTKLNNISSRTGTVAQQTSVGRNPLMLDEVIGLAGLLRNIAFGLYWTEGQAGVQRDKVAGTRVGVEELRSLATRLLQQVHARE